MKTILKLLLCLSMCLVLGASQTPTCPTDYDVGVTLYPNPDDCSTYWECYNGVAILMYCPEGLYFNPKISSCDFMENVECNSSWFQGVSAVRCYCPRTNSYGTKYECNFSLSADHVPCKTDSPCMLSTNEEC